MRQRGRDHTQREQKSLLSSFLEGVELEVWEDFDGQVWREKESREREQPKQRSWGSLGPCFSGTVCKWVWLRTEREEGGEWGIRLAEYVGTKLLGLSMESESLGFNR